MRTFLGTVVAVLAFVVTLPGQQAVRKFTFDDFSRLKRVSDPQFSPDGASLLVVISTPNLDENRHVASIHRVEVASGKSQVIVNGEKAIGVSFPRWAPDGQQLSYLATVRHERPAEASGLRRLEPRRRGQADHDRTERRAADRVVARQPDDRIRDRRRAREEAGLPAMERLVRSPAQRQLPHDRHAAADARVDGAGGRRRR